MVRLIQSPRLIIFLFRRQQIMLCWQVGCLDSCRLTLVSLGLSPSVTQSVTVERLRPDALTTACPVSRVDRVGGYPPPTSHLPPHPPTPPPSVSPASQSHTTKTQIPIQRGHSGSRVLQAPRIRPERGRCEENAEWRDFPVCISCG